MITIKFSEATGAIFAECGHERRNVTDEIIRTMEETGRLQKEGYWENHPERDDIIVCSECGAKYTRESIEAVAIWGEKLTRCCPYCGSRLTEKSEHAPKKRVTKSQTENLPDDLAEREKTAVAPQKRPNFEDFDSQTEERLAEYVKRLKEGGDGTSD